MTEQSVVLSGHPPRWTDRQTERQAGRCLNVVLHADRRQAGQSVTVVTVTARTVTIESFVNEFARNMDYH